MSYAYDAVTAAVENQKQQNLFLNANNMNSKLDN